MGYLPYHHRKKQGTIRTGGFARSKGIHVAKYKRGLTLSEEKTLITHLKDGFGFLGQNTRKYKNKILIKPAKKNVKCFLDGIRKIILDNPTLKQEQLIGILNPKIRGWTNYHRHIVSKKIFSYVAFLWG